MQSGADIIQTQIPFVVNTRQLYRDCHCPPRVHCLCKKSQRKVEPERDRCDVMALDIIDTLSVFAYEREQPVWLRVF